MARRSILGGGWGGAERGGSVQGRVRGGEEREGCGGCRSGVRAAGTGRQVSGPSA